TAKLEELRDELARDHGATVTVVPADLGTAGGAQVVVDAVREAGIDVDVLVNNAGIGLMGMFATLAPERMAELMQLNIVSLTELTRAFVPGMVERKRGRVMNVSSLAGSQPGPTMAVYHASKAYVNSFTRALREELRGTGVKVTLLCPGVTHTGFNARA